MKNKWIYVIIGIGIFLRLMLIFAFPEIGNPKIMDAINYDAIAISLSEGNGFCLYEAPTAFVAPLFPFYLSIIYSIFGQNYLVVKILSAILWGVSIFLIFLIGKEIFNEWVGLVTSLIIAIHPELIGISTFIYTETLNILLLCLSIYILAKGLKSDKDDKKYFILSGFILGLSTLCKGTTMLFPFFLFGIFILESGLRKKIVPLLFFIACFGLAILPWTIRNYIQFDMVLPIATGGGETLWTGSYIPFDGEYRYEQTREKIEELTTGISMIERDSKLMAEAKKNIKENPAGFAKLFVKKIYRFWIKVYEDIPSGSKRGSNFVIKFGLFMIHFPILILALIGIYMSNIRKKEVLLLLSLLFYYTMIHAVTLAVPRYRLPVMPFLIMFSSVVIVDIVFRLIKKGDTNNNEMMVDNS